MNSNKSQTPQNSDSSTMPTPPFFTLPAELRNQIYTLAMQDLPYGHGHQVHRIQGDFTTHFPLRHPWPREPWRTNDEEHAPTQLANMCSVSKQFGAEFRSIWLSSWSAFRISLQWLFKGDPPHVNFEPLRAFLQSLGEQHRSSVSEIHATIPYPAALSDQEWEELETHVREACDGLWHNKLKISINVKVSPGPYMHFGTITSGSGITPSEMEKKIKEVREGQVVSVRLKRPDPILPPTYHSSQWDMARRSSRAEVDAQMRRATLEVLLNR